MDAFGKILYPLNKTNLVKIKSVDKYEIESKLKSTVIKFKLPKKFEGKDLGKVSRKAEFEENLIKWVEKTVSIKIFRGGK
jgi:hypothetical protein